MCNRIEDLIEKARHYEDLWHEALDENARLKTEVDEARRGSGAGMGVMLDLNNQLVAENARLKAEVKQWKGNHRIVIEDRNTLLSSLVNLKAEVERLRKAGDELLGDYKETGVIFPPSEANWNDAKEGKPSV